MLEGVVPFPPEFAKRYRERGYWADKSLAQEFKAVFERYADRIALIDRDRSITYAELDCSSTNLALQKIGCIPIAALVTHRYAEISQFVRLSGATACVIPDRLGDCDYASIVDRIRKESPTLKAGILLGEPREGFLSLMALTATPPSLPASALSAIRIDPMDPAAFQLSGGTTGIPKLIPRTHNDYAYNSKA